VATSHFPQSGVATESSKELVIKKLLIFKQYEVDVKDIKHPLQW
jgi:uncharacterized protein Smg (DUF494 family)